MLRTRMIGSVVLSLGVGPATVAGSVGGFESGSLEGWQAMGLPTVVEDYQRYGWGLEPGPVVPALEGDFMVAMRSDMGVSVADASAILGVDAAVFGDLTGEGATHVSAIWKTMDLSAGSTLSFLWAFDADTDFGNPDTDNDTAFLLIGDELITVESVYRQVIGGEHDGAVFQYTVGEDGPTTVAIGLIEALGESDLPGANLARVSDMSSTLLLDGVRAAPSPTACLGGLLLAGGLALRRRRGEA